METENWGPLLGPPRPTRTYLLTCPGARQTSQMTVSIQNMPPQQPVEAFGNLGPEPLRKSDKSREETRKVSAVRGWGTEFNDFLEDI